MLILAADFHREREKENGKQILPTFKMHRVTLVFISSLLMPGVIFGQSRPLKDSDSIPVNVPISPHLTCCKLKEKTPTDVSRSSDIPHIHSEKPAPVQYLGVITGGSNVQSSDLEYGSLEFLATKNMTERSLKKRSNLCVADVVVDEGSDKQVKYSNEKNVTLYFKVNENFTHLYIAMDIYTVTKKRRGMTLTADDLRAFKLSEWHKMNILAYSTWNRWYLKVSVDGQILRNEYLYYLFAWHYFQRLRINAYGQSLWRYSKPSDHCSSGGQSTLSPDAFNATESTVTSGGSVNDFSSLDVTTSYGTHVSRRTLESSNRNEVNPYITGASVFFGIVALVGAVILTRLWYLRKRDQRSENLELLENAVGLSSGTGLQPGGTRPGSSHDSENSLYGVIP